jgi:serine/threonine protein kinase
LPPNLVAKLGDFGFADANRALADASAGSTVSTQEWAAPEILNDYSDAVSE